MNWQRARRFLQLGQERRDRNGRRPTDAAPSPPRGGLGAARAGSVCVASGKGGTGKSVFTASLAARLSQRGRTLIVDADLGIGNAHILQGIAPERSFVELVAGTAAPREIVSSCGAQLDLIAAGSGVSNMAELSPFELHRVAEALELLEPEYRYLLVDSAAGVSNQTVAFASAADLVVLVTTPDVTAMTDAYAFLKVLWRSRPSACPVLVVNRARDFDEASQVADRLDTVSRKFQGRAPRWLGWIPEDPAVQRSVNARAAVVRHEPGSVAARALDHLTVMVIEELSRLRAAGVGRTLMSRVAYSPSRG